jgi:hypothetical protein
MVQTNIAIDLPDIDFNFALLPAFAELLASADVADKTRELRFLALRRLQGQLARYKELGYTERLLYRIAERKGWMILEISSKADMERLMKPRLPHFDGNRFVPDDYNIPEEELIYWCEVSLATPLNDTGCKRYAKLFQSVFPEKAKEIFSARGD